MIKLVVFDIDGTLIPYSTHKLAEETKQAIKLLQKKQIKVAIATGRQYKAINKDLIKLNFDYYLCGNGSYICDTNGVVLFKDEISDDDINALTEDFIKYNYPFVLRYSCGSYEANPNISIIKYSQRFFSEKQLQELSQYILSTKPQNEKPYACLCHIEEENFSKISSKYKHLKFVITGNGVLCDINLIRTNKGTSLRKLCNYLNVDISQTMAFGDDENDVEMIKCSGIGIAMKNSVNKVKNSADYITDTCENLGVLKALKKYSIV